MKYRDTKNLKEGDVVIRKADKANLIVKSIEYLGQFKLSVLSCLDMNNNKCSCFNHEIE